MGGRRSVEVPILRIHCRCGLLGRTRYARFERGSQMTADCPDFPRSNPFPLLLAGILILLVVLASVHAVIAHGQAAMEGQRCFNGQGQIAKQILYDPLTGRSMNFCNDHGKWYVAIQGPDGGNVTVFPRSFARCLQDVLEYARRSGFTQTMWLH